MSIIPPTTERAARSTDEAVNARIEREARERVLDAARAGRIDERLRELEREWDIERTLESNAAAIGLLGLGLGAFVHRRLYLLPAVVAGFLLQHAVQGWCPPLPIFRRLGIRTAREIEEERQALKALRGDFRGLPQADGDVTRERVDAAFAAVRR
jgi:hypothetical protein